MRWRFDVTAILAISALISVTNAQEFTNETWALRTRNASWNPRTARLTVALGDRLFLVGEANGSIPIASVWASLDAVTWALISVNAFPPRFGACSAALNSEIFIIGGLARDRTGVARYLSDVWMSPDGRSWNNATTAAVWSGRAGASCVRFNRAIYMIGGLVPSPVSEVWHSGNGKDWVADPTPPWPARAYASVAEFGGRIWVVGGTNLKPIAGGSDPLADAWASANGRNWVSIAAPWPRRDTACLLAWPAPGGTLLPTLWLMGGRGASVTSAAGIPSHGLPQLLGDVALDMPLRDAEAGAEAEPFTAALHAVIDRSMGSLAALPPHKSHPVEGTDDTHSVTNAAAAAGLPVVTDVWRSDSDGQQWGQVQAIPEWGARVDYGCVAFGGEVFILGGQRPASSVASASALDRRVPAPRTAMHPSTGRTLRDTTRVLKLQSPQAADATMMAIRPEAARSQHRLPTAAQPLEQELPVAAPGALLNDVWAATANLLCAEASTGVCSGHGNCSVVTLNMIRARETSGAMGNASLWDREAAAGAHEAYALAAEPLPIPFPLNCSCEEGWTDSRCAEPLCSERTCVHGACVPHNVTGPDGRTYEVDVCVCTDPTQWNGSACNTAVCSDGCSIEHGSCSLPGTCECAPGWGGPRCNIELGLLQALGKWVTQHVVPVYFGLTAAGAAALVAVLALSGGRAAWLVRGVDRRGSSNDKRRRVVSENAPLLNSLARAGLGSDASGSGVGVGTNAESRRRARQAAVLQSVRGVGGDAGSAAAGGGGSMGTRSTTQSRSSGIEGGVRRTATAATAGSSSGGGPESPGKGTAKFRGSDFAGTAPPLPPPTPSASLHAPPSSAYGTYGLAASLQPVRAAKRVRFSAEEMPGLVPSTPPPLPRESDEAASQLAASQAALSAAPSGPAR